MEDRSELYSQLSLPLKFKLKTEKIKSRKTKNIDATKIYELYKHYMYINPELKQDFKPDQNQKRQIYIAYYGNPYARPCLDARAREIKIARGYEYAIKKVLGYINNRSFLELKLLEEFYKEWRHKSNVETGLVDLFYENINNIEKGIVNLGKKVLKKRNKQLSLFN